MSKPVKTFINSQNHIVEIFVDDNPINPREDGNLGTMCLFHRRYVLGDKDHGFQGPDEVKNFLDENETISLNVYGYDHGGLTIKTSPFSCPWDSGQLGVIFITKEKVVEEFGDFSKESIERAEKYLRNEVSLYDDYLQGNVYGFRVVDGDKEIDSCWGFYGDDHSLSGLLEAADIF